MTYRFVIYIAIADLVGWVEERNPTTINALMISVKGTKDY
jgi:hypothetical protein